MRIKVEHYNRRWPQDFERISSDLRDALAGVEVLGIEHVGSTSVPGLAAKPVIDVDIVVGVDAVENAIAALERADYVHLGEMGVPDRHAFEAPGSPRRNVYVTVDGSLALRNHLTVRDVLRTDAAAREEYGSLKLRLAERDWETIDHYVEAKSAFLQRILQRSGLTKDELTTIEETNRPTT